MKRSVMALLCALLCLTATAAMALNRSDVPDEVLSVISDRWPAWTLEDYTQLEDLPDGNDYGFALLGLDGRRALTGFRAQDGGAMRYWLRTETAVPQGKGLAWLGRDWNDADWPENLVEDGGPRYEGETRDALLVYLSPESGEDQIVCYRWRNGGFRLSGYLTPGDTPDDDRLFARVSEGMIEFYPFYGGRTDGNVTTVYGDLQTELRYASFATFPMSISEAREKLSLAPKRIVAGMFEAKDVQFTGGQKFPVYLGPGETYAQSGNGKG